MMATTSVTEPKLCRRCSAPLAGDELAGNCPRCLSAILLSAEAPDPFALVSEPVLRRIGDYELLEEVARGGMGIVYRARQIGLDRHVAVKLLRDSLLAGPEDVKRFHAEATAAGRLKHQNIVAIHGVGEEQGQHYLAMDLVSGPNLAQLTRDGPLEPRRAAEITAQIANAVQHAHSQGILHRDLKPSNVLVDPEGVPFVTDFGLARTMDTGSALTLTGQLLGTPAYMSPEQAGGLSEAVGPSSDVYSLGALLFHLLTARPPFVSNNVPELLRQVAKDEPLSPQLLNSAVTSELATVCLKCLAKRPGDRYGSARELSEDLSRFLRHEPILARRAGWTKRLWHWCSREPALASALGFALLILGIGIILTSWQWRRANREAHTAKEELWHAQLLEARSHRLNGGPGQRIKTLEVIAEASAYRPSVELRNEAIAALVLPDLGSNLWWHAEDHVAPPLAFTHDLAFFVQPNQTGRVVVYRAPARSTAVEFDGGSATNLAFAAFSPDDRLLAIRFNDGSVDVWDWRQARLLLRADSLVGYRRLPTFDFTPDGRELWLLGKDSQLERYSTTDGQRLPPLPIKIYGEGISLDASGRRLLAVEEGRMRAWNLNPPGLAGEWVVTNKVTCLAWHPDSEHFAFGAALSGFFAGEVGQRELVQLEGTTGKATYLTSASYTPDGLHLLAGGWGDFFGAWDSATHRLVFQTRDAWFGQINRAGSEVAVLLELRGYGVRQFMNPVGIRRMRIPAVVGDGGEAAAWHPGGRWLLTGHPLGWALWDSASGSLVASRVVDQSGGVACRSVEFLPEGDAFVTSGTDGPQFWPLTVVEGKPRVGESRPLLPPNSGTDERAALSPDGTRFVAVGSEGAFLGKLNGDPQPVRIPGGAGNCFVQYSPDGQWVFISAFKGKTINLHSAATGTLVTNLPIGGYAGWFVPGRNELVAQAPSEMSWWELGTWKMLRRITPRQMSVPEAPIGFWPDASCLLVNGRDMMLRLWDLEAGREIADLRLPESSNSRTPAFDPATGRMVTVGSFPYIRVWDFPALHRELRGLGLDWPDAQPGHGFIGADGRLREP